MNMPKEIPMDAEQSQGAQPSEADLKMQIEQLQSTIAQISDQLGVMANAAGITKQMEAGEAESAESPLEDGAEQPEEAPAPSGNESLAKFMSMPKKPAM